jgi:hypothetical protein
MARARNSVKSYPTDYATAVALLSGKQSAEIDHNTRLERNADMIVVTLHGNAIIRFWDDGRVQISNGGHRASNTTRSRITACGIGVNRRGDSLYCGEHAITAEWFTVR